MGNRRPKATEIWDLGLLLTMVILKATTKIPFLEKLRSRINKFGLFENKIRFIKNTPHQTNITHTLSSGTRIKRRVISTTLGQLLVSDWWTNDNKMRIYVLVKS